MPRTGPAARRKLGFLILLVALPLAAQAQEPAASTPKASTLFLVVRAGPSLSERKIQSALKEGLDLTGSQVDGEPTVRRIAPVAFEEMNNLIGQGGGSEAADGGDAVGIRPLPTADPLTEFRLKTPGQQLKKLTIGYRKGGDKEYVPSAPGKGGSLELIVPGRYALKTEADDEPLRYTAAVSEIGKPEGKLEGEWPKRDSFFVVTLRNFRGDREQLFKTVQDASQVGNPLQNLRQGQDFTFVFADMDAVAATLEEGINDANELVVKINAPQGRNPRRVWMLFPLTKADLEKGRTEFRKVEGDQLPAIVRQNAVTAKDEAAVAPGKEPRWYEIPPDAEGSKLFTRRIPLTELPELTKQYPQAFRLIMWEFENARGGLTAIAVQHPTDGQVYVIDEELKAWPAAIQKAAAKKK